MRIKNNLTSLVFIASSTIFFFFAAFLSESLVQSKFCPYPRREEAKYSQVQQSVEPVQYLLHCALRVRLVGETACGQRTCADVSVSVLCCHESTQILIYKPLGRSHRNSAGTCHFWSILFEDTSSSSAVVFQLFAKNQYSRMGEKVICF